MTLVLGIFGWPVSHSKSPAMHNAAAKALSLDARYLPFAVAPDALATAVAGIRALGIRGVNVTLPHKQAVMAHLDEVHPDARAIGAVNTIIVEEDGRLVGENTDAPGFVRSLVEAGVDINGARVAMIGAGGAARAAAMGLVRAGAEVVQVAARRAEQRDDLAAALADACEQRVKSCASLAAVMPTTDLFIQATSATLAGRDGAADFADSLPIDGLPQHAIVTDMVYTPRTTTVMARAESRGLRTVDGLGMLLHQGAIAFERWTGRAPDVEVMRNALNV